ncbi:MAG: MFS transporter, partial [Planctomycetia bacterium]
MSAEPLSDVSDEPLPPTVRALGWTSFLTDLSSEAVYPLLPGFVKGLGGTSVDVGLVDGIASAVAAIARLPAGIASDSIGRRPLILLGYGLSACVRPLMGCVATPVQAVFVRAFDRLGKGVRSPPRDALVADLVAPRQRGRAFGHIRSLDHAGAALGPLVAMAFLIAFPGAERTLFGLSVLPGLATLAVIWRFVLDSPRPSIAAARPPLEPRLSSGQGWLVACVAVWATGAASEQFLLMRAAELGVPGAAIPLVWFAVSLAKSVTASRAGRIADTASPRATLATAWLCFATAYGFLAFTTSLAATLPLFLAVGAAYGLAEPAERKLVAALAPTGRQGNAFGWSALVQG